jgi:hypothetical protein
MAGRREIQLRRTGTRVALGSVMNRTFLGYLLAASAVASLAGCASSSTSKAQPEPPVNSSTATTKELRLSFSAQSDGQSVRVYASAFVAVPGKGNKPAVLDSGDFFSAKMGDKGEDVVLTREAFDDDVVHYMAVFPSPAEPTDVTLSLTRPAGKISAPTSVVHLPAPFQITSTPPVAVKIGAPLPVSVTPAPKDKFDVDVEGACIKDKKKSFFGVLSFDTEGSATFDTKAIETDPSGSPGCDVTIYVRALKYGTVAPELAGGVGILDGEGLQQRSFRTSLIR